MPTELYIKNGTTVITRQVQGSTTWTETHDFKSDSLTWWLRDINNSGLPITNSTAAPEFRIGSTEIAEAPIRLQQANTTFPFAGLSVLAAESYEVVIRGNAGGDIMNLAGLARTTPTGTTRPGNRYRVWVNTVSLNDNNACSNSFALSRNT